MTTFRTPWDNPVAEPRRIPDPPPRPPRPRGRRPAAPPHAAPNDPDRPAVGLTQTAPSPNQPYPGGLHDHWLCHHLTISGPSADIEAFADAARGAGVIPWRLDGAAIEEQVFALAVAQPPHLRRLTIEGCRILARQFRDRAEARQARAAALIGHSRACPFDLHVLLPIPNEVLQLGPTHPAALAWLTAHWGITDHPRQVTVPTAPSAGRRLPRHHAVIGYSFFAAGGTTPHAAIAGLTGHWPRLRFMLRPSAAKPVPKPVSKPVLEPDQRSRTRANRATGTAAPSATPTTRAAAARPVEPTRL